MSPGRFAVVLDRDLVTCSVSHNYLSHFGAHRNDILGVPLHRHPIIPAHERDGVAAVIERCLREKNPIVNTNHGLSIPTGDLYITRWLNEPKLDERGRAISVVCYGEIIRDRRRGPRDRRVAT